MSETTEATVEIIFSRDRRYYYVARLDHHRPTSWVAVAVDDEGKLAVLPFAFYEVKSGDREQVAESHELVVRYRDAERWPARGSEDWRASLERYLEGCTTNRDNAQRTVDFYAGEISRLHELQQRFA